jgi:hypothetical protein
MAMSAAPTLAPTLALVERRVSRVAESGIEVTLDETLLLAEETND